MEWNDISFACNLVTLNVKEFEIKQREKVYLHG